MGDLDRNENGNVRCGRKEEQKLLLVVSEIESCMYGAVASSHESSYCR